MSLAFEEITSSSSKKDIEALVDMLNRQMEFIGAEQNKKNIRKTLEHAWRPGTRVHTFLLKEDEIPKAMCFANICTGIQAGGDYLWVNEIYVAKEFRRKGLGKILVEYILTWAAKNGCRYAAGNTAMVNKASRTLLSKLGLDLKPTIWIDKSL